MKDPELNEKRTCKQIYDSVPLQCEKKQGHEGKCGPLDHVTRLSGPYLRVTLSLTIDGESPVEVKREIERLLGPEFLEARVTRITERET